MSEQPLIDQTDKIVARLSIVMLEQGLRQADLARATGLSTGYISELIKGRKPFTSPVLSKLADALRVTVRWLASGEGHQHDVGDPWAEPLKGIDWANSDVTRSAIRPEQLGEVMAELATLSRENRELKELNALLGQLTPERRERVMRLVRTLVGAEEPPPPTTLNDVDKPKGE